jgi:hypothetical protein
MRITTIIFFLFCFGFLNAQITVNTNFQVNSAQPIDSRDTVSTFAGLAEIAFPYEGMTVYVVDSDQLYLYKDSGFLAVDYITSLSYKDVTADGGDIYDFRVQNAGIIAYNANGLVQLFSDSSNINLIAENGTLRIQAQYIRMINVDRASTATDTLVGLLGITSQNDSVELFQFSDLMFDFLGDSIRLNTSYIATKEYVDKRDSIVQIYLIGAQNTDDIISVFINNFHANNPQIRNYEVIAINNNPDSILTVTIPNLSDSSYVFNQVKIKVLYVNNTNGAPDGLELVVENDSLFYGPEGRVLTDTLTVGQYCAFQGYVYGSGPDRMIWQEKPFSASFGTGYGLDVSGTSLQVDTNELATQYDLTTITGSDKDTITQASHGFTVGTQGFLPVYNNSGTWAAANTSAASSLHDSYVVEVIDANTFVIQPAGILRESSHGLTVGSDYFLQDAGTISILPDSTYNDWMCHVIDANTLELIRARPTQDATPTASNLGAGEGVFAQKSGNDFQFKSLTAGTGVTLSSTSTEIEISSSTTESGFPLTSITADGTDTLDFQNRIGGFFQIDLSGVNSSNLVFSNPETTNVPEYNLHFQNLSNDTLAFPSNVYDYAGNQLSSRISSTDNLLKCYYDGVNYYCSDTFGIDAAIFNGPADYNPIAWYDAEYQEATLNQYTDGDNIDTLFDRSGNANHLIQPTTGSRPTFRSDSLNSNAIIVFDGTTDYMRGDTTTASFMGSEVTIFTVLRPDNTGNIKVVYSSFLGSLDAINPNGYNKGLIAQIRNDETAQFFFYSDNLGNSTSSLSTSSYSNEWYTHTARVDATNHTQNLNESTDGTSSDNTNVFDNNDVFYLGTRLSESVIERFFQGRIAEVIIYNSALSDAQILNVENYLQTKYGHY